MRCDEVRRALPAIVVAYYCLGLELVSLSMRWQEIVAHTQRPKYTVVYTWIIDTSHSVCGSANKRTYVVACINANHSIPSIHG